ncbi:MAG: caspase family protein [Pseudomonadota bacterium]
MTPARRLALLVIGLLAAFTLAARPAQAAVRRFAVLAGNNEGATGMHRLYFAEHDARRMERVLTSAGGYDPADIQVLLNERRSDLTAAMVAVRARIADARAAGDETLFLFYYSGHGDGTRLHLGSTWITYDVLETLIGETGADVRLAFLDACQSGAMTGAKGGTHAPSFVFDLSERLGAEGQVIITSSSADEASQESDEIGGSYFTHFLTSALVGAADDDGDERVTLAEAYRFVYHETVFRTSGTRTGTQHPTFEWDLAGEGDVVLTDLSEARSFLVFPEGMYGSYAVFDRAQRSFVAEVDLTGQQQRLSLHPGSYLVQRRYPTHLEVARVKLDEGVSLPMGETRFEAVEYEEDVARGSIEKTIRQANLPRLAVRLQGGVLRAAVPEVEAAYLPPTPMGGAGARFGWRSGRWIEADLLTGARSDTLTLPELQYSIPVTVSTTLFGSWAGFATRPRRFQVGGGIGLSGLYLVRAFPQTNAETQRMLTIATGLCGWAGWHPGRFQVEAELRLYGAPQHLDEREDWLRFNELHLIFGYRF